MFSLAVLLCTLVFGHVSQAKKLQRKFFFNKIIQRVKDDDNANWIPVNSQGLIWQDFNSRKIMNEEPRIGAATEVIKQHTMR